MPNAGNFLLFLKAKKIMKLAVFDLDHTLMPLDTGDMWVRWLVHEQGLEPAPVVEQLRRFACEYRAGIIDIDEFEDFQMKFLARFKRKELEKALSCYIKAIIEPAVPEASRRLVDGYRKAGDKTALCTATYDFVSGAIAHVFGIDHTLAAHPEQTPEGEFTGRLEGIASFQEGKVVMVKNLLERLAGQGERVESIDFYSDSCADLPLFEFVESNGGRCFAVNAEKTLLQTACSRGWQVCNTFGAQELAQTAEIAEKLAPCPF